MENFKMHSPEVNKKPVEQEVKKTSGLKEKFQKAFRKGALLTMTTGAAFGAHGQMNENSNLSKDLNTKNKIEQTTSPKMAEAFPENEMVQGITRKQFDAIVLEALAKKLHTTKENLLITASVQLEILLYERFGELSQTKKGYHIEIDEKYFNRDGSINEDYWDLEVEQFISDLQRRVGKVGAYWKTDKDGDKYIVSPNAVPASTKKNLGGAKQALSTLF